MRRLRAANPGQVVEVWAEDEARLGLKPIARRVWSLKGHRPSSNGQSNEPRITFGRAIFSKLYCHCGSNPILAATRSTAIDVFVSLIRRRTCFVSRWEMTLLSLVARRRCMYG